MKKMTREEKKKWIKRLRYYATAYQDIQEHYYGEIARIEKMMNKDLKSKVWEYEIFITDCGWLIGRLNKRTGKKEVLVHDDEFREEAQNE